MSILNKIKSFSFSPNPDHILGIKSGIVWGNKTNGIFPLLYISKPRAISQEDYEILLNNIKISFEHDKE